MNQQPSTNITTMAAAGGNCPLAPHMRPFVPCHCVRLIEEDPDMLFAGVERVYDSKRQRRNERGGEERDSGAKREVARQQPAGATRETAAR